MKSFEELGTSYFPPKPSLILDNYFENDVALFNLYHISILCYEDIFTNKKVFMVDKNIFLLFYGIFRV